MTEPRDPTQPLQRSVVGPAAADARNQPAHRRLGVAGAAIAVGISGLALLLLLTYLDGRDREATLNAKVASITSQQAADANAADRLAKQVRALGAVPVVKPPPPGPPSAAPNAAPSQQAIDDAVASYLSVHPPPAGQSATPAMVAVAVAAYLTANPPTPGRPPTPDEISAAASSYIAAHAAMFQGSAGQSGHDGKPGADATDAQVAAAVAAYCSAHGDCTGAAGQSGHDGKDGAQGVSLTDLNFTRDSSGRCQVVITVYNPATNVTSTITHSAGDAACPLITTPALRLPGTPTRPGG